MALRVYVSNIEAGYFMHNILACDANPPTEGEYIVGDMVISSIQKDGILGWVCTEAGSPGKWEVICDTVKIKKDIELNRSNIAEIVNRLQLAQGEVVKIKYDINAIDKRVKNNEQQIVEIHGQIDSAKQSLITLTGQIANNTKNINKANEDINVINNTIKQNATAAATMVANLQKNLTDLTAIVNKNAEGDNQLELEVDEIKQFIGLEEGDQQGSNLQTEINNIKNELGQRAEGENPATGMRKELDDLKEIVGSNADDANEAATGLQKEINDLKELVGSNADDANEAASGIMKEINDLKDFVGIGEGEQQGPTLQTKIDDLADIVGKEAEGENPATGMRKELDEIHEEINEIKGDLLQYWVGTQKQYDALTEKEPGKLYIIIN